MRPSQAVAVQRAIARAKQDNGTFWRREAEATTGATVGAHVPAMPTGAVHSVSKEDVVLGLRIGSRLMLVDAKDNKTGVFVTAIDALLTKARTALDEEEGASIATPVGDTSSSLTLVRGKRGVIQIFYREQPSAPQQVVDAIGRLDWQL